MSASILLIFVGYLNYLTDSYVMYAASAMAANTVARSAAGAAAPLFTQYMFDALGVGGGGSLIGGIAVLLAPIPFIFYKYGAPIRKRSKFAPASDVGVRENSQQSPGHADDDIEARASSSGSSVTAESDLPGGDTDYKNKDGEDPESKDPESKYKTENGSHEGAPRSKDLETDLEKAISEPLKAHITQ